MKNLNIIDSVDVDAGADDPCVYLTFDDGPNPFCTPHILDVLAQHAVSATFFVIGANAEVHPGLVQRIVSEGHGVANHTMTHPDLATCSRPQVEREIDEANRAIISACPGASIRHIRAPYGKWTEEALVKSASLGLAPVHWSVDPRDWSCPGVDAIVDRVLAAAKPGSIVLLHDGCPPGAADPAKLPTLRDQTLAAISAIIKSLRSRGLTIRSLP
ncbi:chitooligosaccharide deacetylase NodB [Neorhizobium galegae]|uniref:chitooligosaccharide deacetylase NodB n=1 Tax=Neorhizobium galegae TaxID=399 RepID=UPI0006223661|nr:chitooligosaccharide deacetylase NodB [Neorhizobium galegae]CDZ64830.1 Chitooligosaccharide deacetylase NodB [Neorhizobium galegae bv. orientalis]KAB1119809.1 chitooligosaccharide deacetylase NodB [Neorhizobium galegae]MCQ1575115.1 chitooligosaccharide deacetylase NodB [Neorhizobium galegae]MCQ1810844.1 chitooligosaccharide deacetylase NodB [Neorhizobium galegae]MCQ1839187.1 chitooligosaccharide deacetylase NodB [Neorhizobium galegae]